jgi:hypothetical protein
MSTAVMLRRLVIAVLTSFALPVLAAPCAGFTDVTDTDPFCPNVAWIKSRGVTLGCTATLYCPDLAVSRLAMAAFLSRLGDVVLPPNVVWVAPVGGQFQSIQAAIDYVFASGKTPAVIKVAPGTYDERITLRPYVRIEGSGKQLTKIQPTSCASATSSVVVMAGSSQVQDITIETNACLNAILFNSPPAVTVSHADSAIRDVDIVMTASAGAASGIRITGNIPSVGPIEHIRMFLQYGAPSYGVFADTLLVQLNLTDVDMIVVGSTGSTGLRLQGSNARLSRMTINASGPGGPNLFGIDADGPAYVVMRDSILAGVGTQIRSTGPADILVSNTGMANSSVSGPNIVCLYSYNLVTKAPLVC